MKIETKYSIGDLVKVVEPNGKEILIQIDEIYLHVREKGTTYEYHSDLYIEEVENSWEEPYSRPIAICESKEATNGCPIPYIKCRVEVIEIAD